MKILTIWTNLLRNWDWSTNEIITNEISQDTYYQLPVCIIKYFCITLIILVVK